MATCPECGTPNQEGSCDHCGATLGSNGGAGGPGQPPQQGSRGTGGQPRQTAPHQQSPGPGQQGDVAQGAGNDPAASTDEDGGISRRKVLAGGAGAVALAGGGWYFFLRGPTGAKGVTADYVNAIADNNWEQIASLYHEDSPPMVEMENQNVDSYETFLENQGNLGTYEEASPSIDELIEFRHVPDLTQEAAEEVFFRLDSGVASQLDEAKQIIAIVDVDTATFASGQEQYLAGETTKEAISTTVVSDGSGWALWQGSLPV